jgi:hypothetical protein
MIPLETLINNLFINLNFKRSSGKYIIQSKYSEENQNVRIKVSKEIPWKYLGISRNIMTFLPMVFNRIITRCKIFQKIIIK